MERKLEASERAKAVMDSLHAQACQVTPAAKIDRPNITRDELIARFGLGDHPSRRLMFYSWLCERCERGSPELSKMVRQIGRSAATCDNPGNYFVSVVMRRGREMGFFAGATPHE